MKRATGRLQRLAFVLAALRGARAFCSRHIMRAATCRASSRAPALLRWSRKRAHASAAALPRALASTGSWISHFHLHFHLAAALGVPRSLDRTHATAPSGLLARLLPLRFASQNVDRVADRVRHRTPAGSRLESYCVPPNIVEWRIPVGLEPRPLASTNAAGADRATDTAIALQAPFALPRRRIDTPFYTRIQVRGASRVPTARAHVPPRQSLLQTRACGPVALARVAHAHDVGAVTSRGRSSALALSGSDSALRGRAMLTIDTGQSIRTLARASTSVPSMPRASAMRSVVTSYEFAPNGSERPARESTMTRPPGHRIWQRRNAEAATNLPSPRLRVFTMKPPADLVWRANSMDMAGAREPPPVATTSAPSRSSERFTSSARSTPVDVLSPASGPTGKGVVCATALDPVLAQHLLDDVIRRIDLRARIERERRGP